MNFAFCLKKPDFLIIFCTSFLSALAKSIGFEYFLNNSSHIGIVVSSFARALKIVLIRILKASNLLEKSESIVSECSFFNKSKIFLIFFSSIIDCTFINLLLKVCFVHCFILKNLRTSQYNNYLIRASNYHENEPTKRFASLVIDTARHSGEELQQI